VGAEPEGPEHGIPPSGVHGQSPGKNSGDRNTRAKRLAQNEDYTNYAKPLKEKK